jgi:Arc/MetJ-type ribon-helix-helix transcriptional regulator
MPKTKSETMSIRKEYRLSPYIIKKIEELLKTGDFASEAELIRIAILNLYKDYEIEGKIKRKKEKIIDVREVEID